MYFGPEDLANIKRSYSTISGNGLALLSEYVSRNYKSEKAGEYATQGFSRRLKTLIRCTDRVFEILPPDRIELPTEDERTDATINIQAFVFNLFASTDNLAWIWVSEKGLVKPNGAAFSEIEIGLGPKNKLVRQSFSKDFQEYLRGLDKWFNHLKDFRHALAHRIPLYVPPSYLAKSKEEAFQLFDKNMDEALLKKDFDEYGRLEAEQRSLLAFVPWMTHSFSEAAPMVVFHPQLLTDFTTITELGKMLLRELDR